MRKIKMEVVGHNDEVICHVDADPDVGVLIRQDTRMPKSIRAFRYSGVGRRFEEVGVEFIEIEGEVAS